MNDMSSTSLGLLLEFLMLASLAKRQTEHPTGTAIGNPSYIKKIVEVPQKNPEGHCDHILYGQSLLIFLSLS